MNFRTLLFAIVICPLALAAQQDTSWRTYKHPDGLFTIKYPPTWSTKTDETNRVFFTSPLSNDADDFRENVNISVAESPSFRDLQLVKQADAIAQELATGLPEFQLLEKTEWPQDGLHGLLLVYTAKPAVSGDRLLLIAQRFVLQGERMYTMTFTSLSTDQTFHAAGIRVLDSIRF